LPIVLTETVWLVTKAPECYSRQNRHAISALSKKPTTSKQFVHGWSTSKRYAFYAPFPPLGIDGNSEYDKVGNFLAQKLIES
jgi:hypothetical protein